MFNHMTEIADGYKHASYELRRLTRIAPTIPITTASAERSFSALKILRPYHTTLGRAAGPTSSKILAPPLEIRPRG